MVGRKIASVAGFNYSAALKGMTGTWTFDELNKWLTDPRAMVPGTAMTFAGLANEKQRADIIAYLDTLSKNPVPLPKGDRKRPSQAAGAEGIGRRPWAISRCFPAGARGIEPHFVAAAAGTLAPRWKNP